MRMIHSLQRNHIYTETLEPVAELIIKTHDGSDPTEGLRNVQELKVFIAEKGIDGFIEYLKDIKKEFKVMEDAVVEAAIKADEEEKP